MSKTKTVRITPGRTQKDTALVILALLDSPENRPYEVKDGYLWNDGVTRTDEKHDVHVQIGDNPTGIKLSVFLDRSITAFPAVCTNAERGWYSTCGDGVVIHTDREHKTTDADVVKKLELVVRRAAHNDRREAARAA